MLLRECTLSDLEEPVATERFAGHETAEFIADAGVVIPDALAARRQGSVDRVIAEEPEHQGVTDRAILAQRATTMQAVGMKDDEVAWLRRVGEDGPRVWVGLALAFDVGKWSPVAPVERLGRVVGVIIGAAIILRPVM
ncbi:MAG: hypothetical protein ABGY96_06640 [bacterium]